jgi:hypothetical protein
MVRHYAWLAESLPRHGLSRGGYRRGAQAGKSGG